jgi:hypothetical protein
MIISGKRKYELEVFLDLLTSLLNKQDISMKDYGIIYDKVMNQSNGYFRNGRKNGVGDSDNIFKEGLAALMLDGITEDERLFLDFVRILFGESLMIGYEEYMIVVKASCGLNIDPIRREHILRNILKLKIL